ncbi:MULTISPECIES: STAS domain-containing protein [Deefgea]|uniref:STAS domain-containing protein n=1 Tax=Deefgea chitinilytica TaxID=570276 RepID=A0ABS2CBF6_9NEIS|nr:MULTISPECIES: STAS domain-containing protein [Deefgea]MBM5571479.1 STAS domain-containing protein [Deefgea chitinilytica]MBM9888712.1 STAS domain-containing protein [Deefgea sp. CFH1-16]
MFSFFRKKDHDSNHPQTQNGPATVAARAQGVATQSKPFGPETIIPHDNAAASDAPEPHHDTQQYDLSTLKIEVESSSDVLSPAEEQAAMLHANDQLLAAIAILEADKPEFSSKRKLESWLMLFELYQQQQNRTAYDALGLDFVVAFEKTPPVWRQQQNKPQVVSHASAYHAFPAELTIANIEKEAQQFLAIRQKTPDIRVDFSKLKKIDALGAAELVAVLPRRNKQQGQLQILGSKVLIDLISPMIEVGRRIPAEAPFWLLLIEIHQILGLQEEFENLAVDYAITFEVSPPSWDPLQAPKTGAQIAKEEAKAKAEVEQAADEQNHLIGIITADHPQLLDKINDLVGNHTQVTLDFARIDRIDFESAGQLLNRAMIWLQQGKQIRIINTNELVLGLLRVMGITEMLQVERRK